MDYIPIFDNTQLNLQSQKPDSRLYLLFYSNFATTIRTRIIIPSSCHFGYGDIFATRYTRKIFPD